MTNNNQIDINKIVHQILTSGNFEKEFVYTNNLNNLLSEAFAAQSSEELIFKFRIIAELLNQYLQEFDKCYNDFIRYNKLSQQIRDKQNFINKSGQAKMFPLQDIKISELTTKTTQRFISIFQQGRKILNSMRQLITGQTIQTEVTIIAGNNVYRVPLATLEEKNLVQTVLSTYGGRFTSVFSLAYEVDLTNAENLLKDYLIGNLKDQTQGTEIFQRLWQAKLGYLEGLTKKTGRKYNPIFNNKDAEIYDQLLLEKATTITVKRYAALRRQKGRGNPTSSLRFGDVGLIQDKLVTSKTNQVNYTSFSLVRKNLQTLANQFNEVNSPEQIKNILIQTFTIELNKVGSRMERPMARAAIAAIEQKFNI